VSPPVLRPPAIERDLNVIERLASSPANSAYELAKALELIYSHATTADFDDYDLDEVARNAPQIMYRLFDVRLRLRSRIGEFEDKGLMTPAVEQGLRNAFRILRYAADMVGEVAHVRGKPLPDGLPPLPGFRGEHHNTLVNWDFYKGAKGGTVTFRSGDVILVRGERHNSAAIARIGDVDCQFSHACMVYVDEAGAHFVVESLIEDGAVVAPLAKALDHDLARAVLYRHKDAALAARAAKLIHDHVAATQGSITKRILYDFSMQLEDNKRLFCSKLVRVAFGMASNGKTKIPRYLTRIGMQNRDFLRRIGVTARETFAPGDIDLERDFDLVCEWQDYGKTGNVRLQDFTCDKLFEWMDAYGYRFQETALIHVVSFFGRLSAFFSERAKGILSSVAPKVPRNMKRRTVATVAMLHRTADPIYQELLAVQDEMLETKGRPLHGIEVFQLLEQIRRREGRRIGYLVAK
jgi:hypothetical protein